MQNFDHNIGFWEKRQFFRRKLSKIAESCDHNIDPRLGEFSPIGWLFIWGRFFWKWHLTFLVYFCPRVRLCICFDKNELGHTLGDFFHKLIWSPWFRSLIFSAAIELLSLCFWVTHERPIYMHTYIHACIHTYLCTYKHGVTPIKMFKCTKMHTGFNILTIALVQCVTVQ
jgi:hypothetical protein